MNVRAFFLSLGVGAAAATGAGAATFNFADVADVYWNLAAGPDGRNAEGTFEQVAASAAGAGLTDGGISVTGAVGSNTGLPAHAFFDHDGGSGPAGLGVCSSGFLSSGVSRCSSGDWGPDQVTADDNITTGETLGVTFSTSVSFTDLLFRGSLHRTANGTLLINGSEYLIADGRLSTADLQAIGTGSSFSFAYGGSAPTQAYLSASTVAAVPLPAGALLLLGALGGLIGLRRRRAAA